MAEEWCQSDNGLQRMLLLWVNTLYVDDTYKIGLFKSDTHPVSGQVLGDYTEADFDGYMRQNLDMSGFGSVTVTANVASTTNATAINFDVGAGLVGSQTVYGYLCISADDDLIWAVRFASPRVLWPPDRLTIKVQMRLANVLALP